MEYFGSSIEDMEDDDMTIPPQIVNYMKTWGWDRLLPLRGSVKWSDYSNYLEEYYKRNACEVVAGAGANQNPEWTLDHATRAWQISATAGSLVASAAKFCLKMEEELVSEWKTRVESKPRYIDDIFPVNTIIQSSLIKKAALSSICAARVEISVACAVAFVCIAKEADLTLELLKHGAEGTDVIVEQSSLIRMCALGLVNLKGHQSVAAAAAMVGMAKEAKMMCDWIKKENKLVTFSTLLHHELGEVCLTWMKTLDVMINILQESYFPSSKIRDDAMPQMRYGTMNLKSLLKHYADYIIVSFKIVLALWSCSLL